ncbi:NAD-dependent epimerase/dehydratase family protein [Streptosporangium roseum]|uniref:NAD-dependent epimerase/dehydratase family protein n=1 Tax=Streptosporangium roseum TaxID=2001 RepID=UPI00068B2994|nr:NAD-dependent epimerase/dehydratase family protein [Streptosporangium roseum]
MSVTVLVTGAGGFVGSAVVRALAAEPGVSARLLAHRRPVAADRPGDVVTADLADASSLRGRLDGADVIIHAASEVGSDPARCERVNVLGTRNLVEEAERAGVRHLVHVSTAAVHGLGPHRGLPEGSPPAPVSPASRSRREAERLTAAAGAVILRPFFVYGEGDRWYVPGLLRLLTTRPGTWFDGGRAQHSVVAVDDLAAMAVAAAVRPVPFAGGVPFHVCEPQPVSVRAVAAVLAGMFGLTVPTLSVPWRLARQALRNRPGYRRAELLAEDHVYAAPRVWAAAGLGPGAAFLDRLPDLAPWYGRFLGEAGEVREPGEAGEAEGAEGAEEVGEVGEGGRT